MQLLDQGVATWRLKPEQGETLGKEQRSILLLSNKPSQHLLASRQTKSIELCRPVLCFALIKSREYCIAENIGRHKTWQICHERHLAGCKFGRFQAPLTSDVTKWLPSYINVSFLATVFDFWSQ